MHSGTEEEVVQRRVIELYVHLDGLHRERVAQQHSELVTLDVVEEHQAADV